MSVPSRLLLTSLTLLPACGGPGVQVTQGAAIRHAAPKYQKGYQPPVFLDSTRVSRIEAVLPEIEEVFVRNARESHYPGHAYAVLVDGELVLSGGVGTANRETQAPVTADSEFHIASMTKSFTSMAILKLRDEGLLSIQDPVVAFLPELADLSYLTNDAPAVTIEHLMTMTSGFPEDNPWADRHLEDSGEVFMGFLRNGLSMSTVPSTAYEYSNLGYGMLGTIVTRVSGRAYQDYIREEILLPLGMHDTYWEYENVPAAQLALGYHWIDGGWTREPMLHTGAFGAIGGLITSINDFSKYVSFHLSAWPPRSGADDGPVTRSTVREMHRAESMRLSPDAKNARGEPCPSMRGYGFGLIENIDCRGVRCISHTGGLPGFGSQYQFYPDHGVAVISFANRRYGSSRGAHAEVTELLFGKAGLAPRTLPVSGVLASRASQVVELILTWDEDLGMQILADNFYLDRSKAERQREAVRLLTEAGSILRTDPIEPQNQLRGTFMIRGTQRDLRVFFTLSPENEARIQRLDIRAQAKVAE